MSCKDGGVIPENGCPMRRQYGNGEHARKHVGHSANTSISYNRSNHSRTIVSGLYLPKGAFSERFEFVEEVVEVDVLTTVVEVGVHRP